MVPTSTCPAASQDKIKRERKADAYMYVEPHIQLYFGLLLCLRILRWAGSIERMLAGCAKMSGIPLNGKMLSYPLRPVCFITREEIVVLSRGQFLFIYFFNWTVPSQQSKFYVLRFLTWFCFSNCFAFAAMYC